MDLPLRTRVYILLLLLFTDSDLGVILQLHSHKKELGKFPQGLKSTIAHGYCAIPTHVCTAMRKEKNLQYLYHYKIQCPKVQTCFFPLKFCSPKYFVPQNNSMQLYLLVHTHIHKYKIKLVWKK